MNKITDASFIEVAQIAAIAGRKAVQRSKEMNQTQVISQGGSRNIVGFVSCKRY